MGNGGQIANIVLASTPGAQTSCRFRRRGAAKTMDLHLRQNMYQTSPIVIVVYCSAQVEEKYFKEDLLGQHLDCHLAYVAMISRSRKVVQKYREYIDLAWLISLQSGNTRPTSIRKGHPCGETPRQYGEMATWLLRCPTGRFEVRDLVQNCR